MNTNTNYVAVGVDGSPAARSALLWAVDECRIRRQTLVIAHAPDPQDAALLTGRNTPAFHSLDDVGEQVLRDHAAAASARQPSVVVTTWLGHSTPADALIDLSAQADLLVVGSQGHGGSVLLRALGSVSDRVAAHAHCPVAIVSDTTPGPGAARVVVGVSPTYSGRLALQFALDEARLRDATLIAVSAMRDQQTEPDPFSGLDVRALRDGAGLLDELDSLTTSYPDVIIEPTLADTDPATALLDAARDAQLVVVGCHHSDDRWSTRLGPVPSTIAHRAPCPVVVVGQRRHVAAGSSSAFATDFA
ncbi:MAG TPA: universal stress protein [Jatrophihabitantaceae bacterium]